MVDADAWARRTAARLRLIHSSFADQSFEQKRMYLEDEIEFALEDAGAVDPQQRKELLEKLSGSFPIFSELSAAVPAPAAESQISADPLEQFLELWKNAAPEQREAIGRTLAAAGVTAPAPAAAPQNTLPEEIT